MKYGTLLLFVGCALLVGCKEEGVKHYKVAKEESTAVVPTGPPPTAQMPGLAAQTSAFKTPKWVVPGGWVEQEPGPMRKGLFVMKEETGEAEVSVAAFPGNVGGKLANINRWAGQIGLVPLQASVLDKLEPIDVDGNAGELIQLEGLDMSLIAVIVEKDGSSWFFKLMGDRNIVDSQRDAFLGFIESIVF